MDIIGTGRRHSLQELVEVLEQEYRQRHVAPARLMLKSDNIEIECERPQPDVPFQSWIIRLPADGELFEHLQGIQSEFSDDCSLTQIDGRQELCYRRSSGDDAQTDANPLERLSQIVTWPEVWRMEGEDPPAERLSPERLFNAMRALNASDIHLYPGAAPVFRVNNQPQASDEFAAVSTRQIEDFLFEVAPERAWADFQKDRQCSFNYRQTGIAYSRVSAFIKSGVPHCTIRYLPERIPDFEDLFIPRSTMERLAKLHEGLVLVSGMTGSGKSTTVASLIDWMNANAALHILTIESPVEFVHVNKRSMISQRDVGIDTSGAVEAVHGAMRHDPDVIFIGEMRDPETIRAGMDAASTGHLVISTFHANTASEVPNRLVSFFDPVERDLVRLQLRDCLRCVMCQRLLPRKTGGRVPALEFLFNDTPHIGEGLLSGNTAALRVAMQQTTSESSIFEQSLLSLFRDNLISEETAAEYASNAALFEQMRLGTYAVPSLESMQHRTR